MNIIMRTASFVHKASRKLLISKRFVFAVKERHMHRMHFALRTSHFALFAASAPPSFSREHMRALCKEYFTRNQRCLRSPLSQRWSSRDEKTMPLRVRTTHPAGPPHLGERVSSSVTQQYCCLSQLRSCNDGKEWWG